MHSKVHYIFIAIKVLTNVVAKLVTMNQKKKKKLFSMVYSFESG